MSLDWLRTEPPDVTEKLTHTLLALNVHLQRQTSLLENKIVTPFQSAVHLRKIYITCSLVVF